MYRRSEPHLSDEELLVNSKKYISQIKFENSQFTLWLLSLLPTSFGFRKINIGFMDTDWFCTFDLQRGLRFVETKIPVDVTLSTRSLNQIFKFQWGIGTVMVNGRYRASQKGKKIFVRIFMLGLWNSRDKKLTLSLLLNKCLAILFGIDLNTGEEFSLYKSWNRWISHR